MDNNFQPISIEQINSVSFGDDDFKRELINIFLEQIPEFISNMKRFLEENDLVNLAKEAHTAKSSVLIFGLESTGISCKEIQLQAEAKEVDNLAHLVNKVELELLNANEQLRSILVEL